eukprot:17276-Heterococcus_DN1.PRE.2
MQRRALHVVVRTVKCLKRSKFKLHTLRASPSEALCDVRLGCTDMGGLIRMLAVPMLLQVRNDGKHHILDANKETLCEVKQQLLVGVASLCAAPIDCSSPFSNLVQNVCRLSTQSFEKASGALRVAAYQFSCSLFVLGRVTR